MSITTVVVTDAVGLLDPSNTRVGGASAPIRTDPTGSTAQPVTDNGSTLSVDDGGGSLTVDGSINADVRVGGSAVSNGNPVPISDAGGSLTVDGSVSITGTPAVTVSSGTVTANIGTGGSLALDATLTGGSQKAIVRGAAKGSTAAADATVTSIDADHSALDVNVLASALPTGAATSAKQDTGNTSLSSIDGKITACNTGAVTVSSSALPTGAATSAKQDTGNTSLASIDGKLPALVSSRVPVDGSGVTQPVSDGGGSLTVDGTIAATQSGSWSVSVSSAPTTTVTGSGSAGTPAAGVVSVQGVSGGTVLPVSDGGGSLTVDGAVTVTGAAASGAALSGNPVLVAGSDGTNARTIATTTGGVQRILTEYGTPLTVPSRFSGTSIAGAGTALRSSAGVVVSYSIYNGSGGAVNLMLFDSTTQPANSTVPVLQLVLANGSTTNSISTVFPFGTGIYAAVSSTTGTYTSIAGSTTIAYSIHAL